MTVTELKERLAAADIHASQLDETHLGTLIPTTSYQNDDGKNTLAVVIELIADGSILRLSCPSAFTVSADGDAIPFRLMAEQAKMPFVAFEYDPSDGEVRPRIEIPAATTTSDSGENLLILLKVLSVAVDKASSALDS